MPDEKHVINYQGNSQRGKEKDEAKADKKVEKVTSGGVVQRKKPLGKRIAEAFTGDDMHSVGRYILMDVLVPAAKNMISDALSQGVERALFGESRPRSPYRSSGSYTSYNRMSSSSSGRPPWKEEPRTMSHRARATHDFSEVIFERRGDAEVVLDTLTDLIDQFGMATVSDLYDAVGITGNFTDNKWGWKSMGGARVHQVRDGYLLEMPRPEQLD